MELVYFDKLSLNEQNTSQLIFQCHLCGHAEETFELISIHYLASHINTILMFKGSEGKGTVIVRCPISFPNIRIQRSGNESLFKVENVEINETDNIELERRQNNDINEDGASIFDNDDASISLSINSSSDSSHDFSPKSSSNFLSPHSSQIDSVLPPEILSFADIELSPSPPLSDIRLSEIYTNDRSPEYILPDFMLLSPIESSKNIKISNAKDDKYFQVIDLLSPNPNEITSSREILVPSLPTFPTTLLNFDDPSEIYEFIQFLEEYIKQELKNDEKPLLLMKNNESITTAREAHEILEMVDFELDDELVLELIKGTDASLENLFLNIKDIDIDSFLLNS